MARGQGFVMGQACFFKRVRKWIVPDVVQQRGQPDDQAIVGIELSQLGDDTACQVIGAERMLEPCVCSAGIDEKRVTELPDVAQALYGRRVQDRERLGLEADVVPERVADDFVRGTGDSGLGARDRRAGPLGTPRPRTARNSAGIAW